MTKAHQHNNPYVREANKHWWMWELIKFNPSVFYIKPGNSTFMAALCIKAKDRIDLLQMLKLIGIPPSDMNWYSSYSHIRTIGKDLNEITLVALPGKEEKKFRKHLRASCMLVGDQ